MNKFIKISSLLLLLPFLQSCFMQQEDLFDNSAMERLEAKKTETIDVLSSAPNGWEMQYFVTGEAGKRGYVLLVKFEKSGDDGLVTFAGKNAVTNNKYVITDGAEGNDPKSYFDVVFDNGPVLTFNSYNNLFHKFSDPNGGKLPGDGGLGVGLGGDYEFTVISVSSEKVVLKGKKRGTYSILTRLPDNQDWKGYFDQLDAINNSLYNDNPAPLKMVADGKSYYLYDGASSIYSAVLASADDMTFSQSKKFIQTINGLRFENNFEIDQELAMEKGYSFLAGQDFYFNEDKSKMVSYIDNDPSKGVLASIESVSPYWFYNKALAAVDDIYVSDWQISEENMGASFKAKYDAMKASFDEKGRTGLTIYIGGLSGYGDALQFNAKNIQRNNYWIQLSRGEDASAAEVIKYAQGPGKSKYYDTMLNVFTPSKDFVACFDREFKVELVNPFDMSSVRLVAVDDPEMSFVVTYVKK